MTAERPSLPTPIDLVTGFLGSGKTTLLQRLLTDPSLADAAILINEFGEIGLDHHLLERVDNNVVLMKSGCICCTVRGEIADALLNLHALRAQAKVPWFDRVVIETTGLADPYPVLSTIRSHPVLRNHFTTGRVLTTLDAVNGHNHVTTRMEALRQVAAADTVVITKTDLCLASDIAPLAALVRSINPVARLLNRNAEIDAMLAPADGMHSYGLPPPALAAGLRHHGEHSGMVKTFAIITDDEVDWVAFGVWLTMLLNRHGDRVLRVKGILNIASEDRPVAIAIPSARQSARCRRSHAMSRICLITTGGTIASRLATDTGHVTVGLSGEELRATLHDPLDGIDIEVEEFCRVGSYAVDLPLAFALAQWINWHVAQPDCDGVVVTHGTDTMEESAYMSDLIVIGDKPVVFTGAQRAADNRDADGPRNIGDSIRLAAAPEARGLGTVICFEQEFHAARDVTKTHTSRVDTFMSGEHGKLGDVVFGEVVIHRRPTLRRTYDAPRVETDVELIKLTMGSGDGYLRYAAQNGAKAIVIEGFGLGNAPPAVTKAAGEIVAQGIPVIMTSRCPRGSVRPVYGNGGGKTLFEAGVIFAGDLNGPKARILASVVLSTGAPLGPEIRCLGGASPAMNW